MPIGTPTIEDLVTLVNPTVPHDLADIPTYSLILLAAFLASLNSVGIIWIHIEKRPHLDTSRDYAWSLLSIQTVSEVGQRRMMQTDTRQANFPTISLVQKLGSATSTQETDLFRFSFSTPPLPTMGLTFLPRPLSRSLKRGRAAADIDGEHSNLQKKKRRLRLFLITSRLSPQFSHPATNIVDRGSSKIAVWAKQKSLGQNLLRKAAILNRVRRSAMSARGAQDGRGRVLVEQEREQEQIRMAKSAFKYGCVDTYTRPVIAQPSLVPPACAVRTGDHFVLSGSPSTSRSPSPSSPSPPPSEAGSSKYCSPNEAYAHLMPHAQVPRRDYLPIGPSPLGLSNYDAFDMEEDIPDLYSHLDDEDEEDRYTPTFPYDDDDDDECPFSPSAATFVSHSTVETRTSEVPETPPQAFHPDYTIREPVAGSYDTIEDTTDIVWPDSPILFASAKEKELPSIPPNLQPLSEENSAVQPNNPPSKSPNFPSTSPNFTPSSPSTNASTSSWLNLASLSTPTQQTWPFPTKKPPTDKYARKDSAMEEEQFRQRNIIFTRFES